jgi:DNA-binding response OmpR family regulator
MRRADARKRALQAGVIGYLTKPFSEDELLACIRSVQRIGAETCR